MAQAKTVSYRATVVTGAGSMRWSDSGRIGLTPPSGIGLRAVVTNGTVMKKCWCDEVGLIEKNEKGNETKVRD